jgi:hypothetical protein
MGVILTCLCDGLAVFRQELIARTCDTADRRHNRFSVAFARLPPANI